jgi:hypothetical protein
MGATRQLSRYLKRNTASGKPSAGCFLSQSGHFLRRLTFLTEGDLEMLLKDFLLTLPKALNFKAQKCA